MAYPADESQPFTGFGLGSLIEAPAEAGVFILTVYRDGVLTAAAHATERGAMEAAIDYLESEQDESDEGGALEDRYARAQEFVSEEGGLMEIIAGPIYGS